MTKKTVTISIETEIVELLSEKKKKTGVSVSKYIEDLVLTDLKIDQSTTNLGGLTEEELFMLTNGVSKISSGEIFLVGELFLRSQWQNFTRSEQIKLAKSFSILVNMGKFEGITLFEKDKTGKNWYIKN